MFICWLGAPLPGKAPYLGSVLQAAAWAVKGKLLNFLLPTWSASSTARAQHVGALAELSSLTPALEQAEPGPRLPAAGAGALTGPVHRIPPQLALLLGRPEKEVLVKDPEVERRMEGFQGGVAVGCHNNPRAFPHLNQTSPLVVLSKVRLSHRFKTPSMHLAQRTKEMREQDCILA